MAGALLGWRPDEFWAATPAELMAVVRALVGEDGGGAADAVDLMKLQNLFPD
jgi:hypothetical protein